MILAQAGPNVIISEIALQQPACSDYEVMA